MLRRHKQSHPAASSSALMTLQLNSLRDSCVRSRQAISVRHDSENGLFSPVEVPLVAENSLFADKSSVYNFRYERMNTKKIQSSRLLCVSLSEVLLPMLLFGSRLAATPLPSDSGIE